MHKGACTHLTSVTDIPLLELLHSKKKAICSDCDCVGPNLWICLNKNCLKIGCSESYNDHNTYHNQIQPSHAVHMNLSTKRVWCYQCESEIHHSTVIMHNNNLSETKQMESIDETCVEHASKEHCVSTEPPTTFAFENTVGLNVGMSGDTSESSDIDDQSKFEIEKPFGLVGLQNIGNTCYMNAALQALSNTLPLTNFFLECSAAVYLLSEGRKPGLCRTYQALIRDMWLNQKYGYVTPSGILYGIRSVYSMFRGYHQHDTQEFLRNFMDQLHEELKQVCPPEIISDIDINMLTIDESAMNSSFESSEGEYETCDSGVSERSSLSDETEKPATITRRKLSRSRSPCHNLRPHIQNSVIDSQPTSCSSYPNAPKPQTKYRSIISDIFDGKLLSSVQCLTCSRISSRIETFQDLSLPIPSKDHLVALQGRSVETGGTACSEAVLPIQDGWLAWILSWLRSWFYGPTISLHDCLAAFFSTDELKGDNMYSCERCSKLRNGIKFSKVLQLPEVLCIHLKRFRHELMFSSKISSYVSFPLKGLDVRPYLHTDCVSSVSTFDLFSVICHHGTAGGGHYTCYALNGNQWYEFDDQCVTKVSDDSVLMCEAYVLFYRKNATSSHTVKMKASELVETYSEVAEEMTYISKQWISRFKACAEPGPIDNSDFLCRHGQVNPERMAALRQLTVVLPKQAYEYLHKKFGGFPPVLNLHVCTHCVVLQKRQIMEFETFTKLNRDFLNHKFISSHLISTLWFAQWQNFVHKRVLEPPGHIDNNRLLSNGSTNDYIEINEEMWQFFYNIYGGGPELPIYPSKILHRTNSELNLSSSVDMEVDSLTKNEDIENVPSEEIENIEDHTEQPTLEVDNISNDVLDFQANSNVPNCSNELHSSESNTSQTDEETCMDILHPYEQNKCVTKAPREKLRYRTYRRRRQLSYKNKHLTCNNSRA